MIAFVQGITTSGELDEGSSYELIAILNAAETNLDRIESDQTVGNPYAEPAELRYFISQIKDKIESNTEINEKNLDRGPAVKKIGGQSESSLV